MIRHMDHNDQHIKSRNSTMNCSGIFEGSVSGLEIRITQSVDFPDLTVSAAGERQFVIIVFITPDDLAAGYCFADRKYAVIQECI